MLLSMSFHNVISQKSVEKSEGKCIKILEELKIICWVVFATWVVFIYLNVEV